LFDSTGAGNNVNLNPGGGWSTVRSISDSGQIVGFDVDAGALLFDDSGSGNNINLGGGKRAYSINNNNQIVGGSGNGVNTSAWLWDLTGGINITLLGQGEATSISDNGLIVGNSHPISGEGWHATLFDSTGGGNNIDLGKLFATDDRSFARSINDHGQIVGHSGGPGSVYTATLYDPNGNGNNIALGVVGNSYANSINNDGLIVGREGGNATLFDIAGSGDNINLNDLIDPSLGWTLTTANYINDNGWIIGGGINPSGQTEAFLLTPEPSTPPVADADGPYTIYVGDTLTLDASGSTDDDNDITSYMWDLDDNGSFETNACGQEIFDVNYAYLESLGLLVNNTYNIHLKVIDSEEQSDVNDSTFTIVPKPALVVAVDIKPTSCPNPLNIESSGVLPVAILGSEDVNVVDIDATSIQLAGVSAVRHAYEDVAGPVSDTNDCNCTEDGPDGYLDLTLKFKTQEIVEELLKVRGQLFDGEQLVLELTGVLFGERPIEGTDCVVIKGKVPKGLAAKIADINKDGVIDVRDFAMLANQWLVPYQTE
jgi:uncharacterized membrane protein